MLLHAPSLCGWHVGAGARPPHLASLCILLEGKQGVADAEVRQRVARLHAHRRLEAVHCLAVPAVQGGWVGTLVMDKLTSSRASQHSMQGTRCCLGGSLSHNTAGTALHSMPRDSFAQHAKRQQQQQQPQHSVRTAGGPRGGSPAPCVPCRRPSQACRWPPAAATRCPPWRRGLAEREREGGGQAAHLVVGWRGRGSQQPVGVPTARQPAPAWASNQSGRHAGMQGSRQQM